MAAVYSRIGTLTLYPHLALPAELDHLAEALLAGSPTPRRGRRPKAQAWLTLAGLDALASRELPVSALSATQTKRVEDGNRLA